MATRMRGTGVNMVFRMVAGMAMLALLLPSAAAQGAATPADAAQPSPPAGKSEALSESPPPDGLRPPTEAPPPPSASTETPSAEIPEPTPPPAEESTPPTEESLPTAVPTIAPTTEPTEVPIPDPIATPGEVGTPTPTPIPAPSVRCERKGEERPARPGQIVGYRCEYTAGPLKPVVDMLPHGWEYSFTGEEDSWSSHPDPNAPVYNDPTGIVHIFIRATGQATPGADVIAIMFRAADYGSGAPKSEVHIPVALLATTPAPMPTAEAPVAFDPVLECVALDDPVAGAPSWAYQRCSVAWQTKNVSAVEVRVTTSTAGWQVIAGSSTDPVAPRDTGEQGLVLTDPNPDDDGFFSAHLFIGTRLECDASASSEVEVRMAATSRAPVPKDAEGRDLVELSTQPEVTEVARRTVAITGTMPSAPSVTVTSASFTAIDLDGGSQRSTGTFTFIYDDAPAACGWQATVRLGDFVNGDVSIPISNLEYDDFVGLDASVASPDAGIYVITPLSASTPRSGAFTLTVRLTLGGFIPQGRYGTTVNVDVAMDP